MKLLLFGMNELRPRIAAKKLENFDAMEPQLLSNLFIKIRRSCGLNIALSSAINFVKLIIYLKELNMSKDHDDTW